MNTINKQEEEFEKFMKKSEQENIEWHNKFEEAYKKSFGDTGQDFEDFKKDHIPDVGKKVGEDISSDDWEEIFKKYSETIYLNVDQVRSWYIPFKNWLEKNYSSPAKLQKQIPEEISSDELGLYKNKIYFSPSGEQCRIYRNGAWEGFYNNDILNEISAPLQKEILELKAEIERLQDIIHEKLRTGYI